MIPKRLGGGAVVASEKEPLQIGDSEFEEVVLQSRLPAMVDFWAPWCGPCRIIAPAVKELAEEYDGQVLIAKVNTDEHQEWARHLNIRGIPTVVFFRNGEEVDRLTGAVPKDILIDRINSLL